jgi:hypothetical protein
MAVISLEIVDRIVLADGKPFGPAGAYERLSGTIRLAVAAEHAFNGCITDLGLAPRAADGRVHFECDFTVTRPVEVGLGSGRLLFDVPNRGRPVAWSAFNGAPGGLDPGTGFMMHRGYTIASCGWQHDVPAQPGLLALRAPEALENGEPIRGPIMCEFQPSTVAQVQALGEPTMRPYPTFDVRDPTAVLTVRDHTAAPARVIPRDAWRFARLDNGKLVPDATSLYLPSGFQAGHQYTIVYTAHGAPVVGAGLLAVRDVAAWLRYGHEATGNPCAGAIRHSYAFGVSQSAHFLRQFLHLGLNEDEQQRQVFDGVLPVVGSARRGEFNVRFGQPGKTLGRYVGALFPFSDATQTDPFTSKNDGLLTRLEARGKVPKIVVLDSSAEYWSRQASLIHTTPGGNDDLDPPESTRIYFMTGTQHAGGGLPSRGRLSGLVRYEENSVDYLPLVRAALVNLDEWVSAGKDPPPSRFPRLDDGTAVVPDHAVAFFRSVPSVRVPDHIPTLARFDFGPEADRGVLSQLPPIEGASYSNAVSAVDDDGNEVAGVRLPDVAVPLASYTGWNLRHPDTGAPDELLLRSGATLRFSRTAAERAQTGDPRRSIEERYASKEDFLERVRREAAVLVAERYVLEADMDPILAQAELRWDLYSRASEPSQPHGDRATV